MGEESANVDASTQGSGVTEWFDKEGALFYTFRLQFKCIYYKYSA